MADHRGAQTPVRDQRTRPTCVAFAVSAAHEWMAADDVIRSVEDALWAAHQVGSIPGREETTVSWAFEGLAAHGHATEAAWPYGSPGFPADRPAAALSASNRRALSPWGLLDPLSFESIRDELERPSAVVLTLPVVRSAWRAPDGVIDAEPGRKAPGNHAVLAVGALDEREQIVIKNSWGDDWGDSGYGYVSRRYIESYVLRAHILEAT
jgi:hypothetical protein